MLQERSSEKKVLAWESGMPMLQIPEMCTVSDSPLLYNNLGTDDNISYYSLWLIGSKNECLLLACYWHPEYGNIIGAGFSGE